MKRQPIPYIISFSTVPIQLENEKILSTPHQYNMQ